MNYLNDILRSDYSKIPKGMHCMTNIDCLKNKSDIPAYEIGIGLCGYYLAGISHVNNLFLIAVWNPHAYFHLLW